MMLPEPLDQLAPRPVLAGRALAARAAVPRLHAVQVMLQFAHLVQTVGSTSAWIRRPGPVHCHRVSPYVTVAACSAGKSCVIRPEYHWSSPPTSEGQNTLTALPILSVVSAPATFVSGGARLNVGEPPSYRTCSQRVLAARAAVLSLQIGDAKVAVDALGARLDLGVDVLPLADPAVAVVVQDLCSLALGKDDDDDSKDGARRLDAQQQGWRTGLRLSGANSSMVILQPCLGHSGVWAAATTSGAW